MSTRALLRPPRRARPLKIILGVVGAIVVLAVAGTAIFLFSLANTYNSSRQTLPDAFPAASARPPASTGKAASAVNILLLGTDVDAADPESPQMVGKRQADTVMVIHVPSDRKRVYVMSILRNSVVDVPGHGQQPINSAFAFGGSKLTVQAVEGLTGVRMDHVVVLTLSGMKGLTNALGGVTVHSSQTVVGKDGDEFPAGTHKLNGTQALSFIRAGNFKATGDSQRAAAQEAYFRGVFDDVLSAKTLLDPVTISTVVSFLSPYLATDKGFDAATVGSLGYSLRGLHSGDIRMLRLPASGIGKLDGATVVNLDPAGVDRIRAALKADRLETVAP